MISFNRASISELEEKYVVDALRSCRLSGDAKYTKRVYDQFRNLFGLENILLTTSGSASLEMAALLIDLEPGDEVIVPSFTFSSTANAFIMRGAKPVFCDIRKDTMNIDETLIEGLITDKTKAIFPIDYAGVPCDMDAINGIAKKHGLHVVEDSAQSVGSTYKGRNVGTLAELSCFSFHETKNYAMGEGGALVVNDERYMERAEIIREKGTNRSNVLKGIADKYTWHDIGSSYLPSDILAALLSAQMDRFEEIMRKRLFVWNLYQEGLSELENEGLLRRPIIPDNVTHNAHLYNIILPSTEDREYLIEELKARGIVAYICYIPLHSSPMGRKFGYLPEDIPVTEDYGSRVLRLPLYTDMTENDALSVIDSVSELLRSSR